MHSDNKKPIGIIDIGSNSIRLVMYEWPYRGERPFFNEKIQCGLGEDLEETGYLCPVGIEKGLSTLRGFSTLIQATEIETLRVIGTAALRDAKDSNDFIKRVKDELDIDIDIISGEEEATYSAQGVLTFCSDAQGLVGDLGGGSLELALLSNQKVTHPHSIPTGVLRVMKHPDPKGFIQGHLNDLDKKALEHDNLYTVGGTWRAIGQCFLQDHNAIQTTAAGVTIDSAALYDFCRQLSKSPPQKIISNYHMESRRAELLPYSSLVLAELVDYFSIQSVTIAQSSLRDGLLADMLDTL